MSLSASLIGQVRGSIMSEPEKIAVLDALTAADQYGYGNLMAWIATGWAVKLRDSEGFTEKQAIECVSNRGPYALPPSLNPAPRRAS